jgi:hypothetical protein
MRTFVQQPGTTAPHPADTAGAADSAEGTENGHGTAPGGGRTPGRGRAARRALGLGALLLAVAATTTACETDPDKTVKEVRSTTASDGKGTAGSGSEKNGNTGSGEKTEKADKNKALTGGSTAVFGSGLKITVSAPKTYRPSEFAAGHTEGNKAYAVDVVVQNDSKEKFDAVLVMPTARAGEDGVEAEAVFDGEVGGSFDGSLLPGKKATEKFVYSVPADAKTLTVEIQPGFDFDSTHWELKL